MKKDRKNRKTTRTHSCLSRQLVVVGLVAALGAAGPMRVTAAPVTEGMTVTAAGQLAEPVIASEGAVVMDAATGSILYGKNPYQKQYPASITKLMTALLVIENCSLDETVTFSASATTGLEAGAVSLNLVEGDKLTVRQCLYALLLKSANEVGNALAEHVAGSVSAFADMMNKKAATLGCTGTHFTNPHGLNDPEHYTTPYDMALIGRAALANETLQKIASTRSYQLPATKKNEARTITMGHKMMYPTDSRYYPGIIGGKTGYTSKAGNTLVTGAEREGVRLIAVTMKSNSSHYTDTKALLDYGFAKMTGEQVQTGPVTQGTVSGTAPGQINTGTAGADQQVIQTAPGTAAGTENEAVQPVSPTQPPVQQVPADPTQAESAQTGWAQEGERWYYIKPDGLRAAGEWLAIDGETYWFDADGFMAEGWRIFDNGDWYYFHRNGTMAKNLWKEDLGKWFYLGENGAVVKNTTLPGGYVVDASGALVQ